MESIDYHHPFTVQWKAISPKSNTFQLTMFAVTVGVYREHMFIAEGVNFVVPWNGIFQLALQQ